LACGGTLKPPKKRKDLAMTVLEQMAEWVVGGGDAHLPQTVRERLAIHLLDTVGAWIAGGATEEGAKLAHLASNPSQPLSIFGKRPLDRIALGVATTRLTEIDDIHMPSCTTPSSVIIPAALVVAGQMRQRSAQVFGHALRAGYEVMTWFGLAVAGPTILQRGIWPTYLAAPVCTAAFAARLLGLSAEKTANALAISLTMASGAPGRPVGASPRWLLLGIAARGGCEAALAASEGYSGDRKHLDDDWMVRTHGIQCDAGPLVAADGGDSAVGALSLKPYCAAKQTIAAIDAFREILGHSISPNDIVALRVAVPSAYAKMIGHRDAGGSRIARITSAAYQLALAAYRPGELENVARPNLAADPDIAAFMARVEVVPDQTLEQHYPARWPARVEAVLESGRTETNLVLDATGDPPLSCRFDVRAKFHRLADPVIGKPAASELEDACLAATEQDHALAKLCDKMNP
jgi:2-methylcitrate dehydratase PrpD